jgi:protein gp37
MQPTNIPWADVVWNPVSGCTPASAGCANCYARELHNKRHKAYLEGKMQNCPQYAEPFEKIQLLENRLDQPLRTRTPKRIFVNSMSDLFHPDVPEAFIWRAIEIMFNCQRHTFIILTKHAERMADILTSSAWWNNDTPQNIWLLVSIENQKAADERIPLLLQVPVAMRGVSIEPMLGPVDIEEWLHPHDFVLAGVRISWVNWVICGAESGPNRRPFNIDWALDLKNQCVDGVPFFYKQGYDHNPSGPAYTGFKVMPLLDGQVWDQMPEPVTEDAAASGEGKAELT